jgi:hypothetical protein
MAVEVLDLFMPQFACHGRSSTRKNRFRQVVIPMHPVLTMVLKQPIGK